MTSYQEDMILNQLSTAHLLLRIVKHHLAGMSESDLKQLAASLPIPIVVDEILSSVITIGESVSTYMEDD